MTELAILRKYAAGLELLTISKDLGVDHEVTTEVVSAVGYQRGRARALLIEREAALMKSRGSGAAPVSAPPAPVEVKVELERRVATPIDDLPDLGDLLDRADQAGGKFARQGARLRAMVLELEESLAANAEVMAAEQRVNALRRQLEEANAKLRGLKPGATARPATSSGPKPAIVRAWARAAGIEVAPLGRVPDSVMEKYYAAHPEASRG